MHDKAYLSDILRIENIYFWRLINKTNSLTYEFREIIHMNIYLVIKKSLVNQILHFSAHKNNFCIKSITSNNAYINIYRISKLNLTIL